MGRGEEARVWSREMQIRDGRVVLGGNWKWRLVDFLLFVCVFCVLCFSFSLEEEEREKRESGQSPKNKAMQSSQ